MFKSLRVLTLATVLLGGNMATTPKAEAAAIIAGPGGALTALVIGGVGLVGGVAFGITAVADSDRFFLWAGIGASSFLLGGLSLWPGIVLDNEGNNMSLKAISTEDAAKLKLPHAEAITQYNAELDENNAIAQTIIGRTASFIKANSKDGKIALSSVDQFVSNEWKKAHTLGSLSDESYSVISAIRSIKK